MSYILDALQKSSQESDGSSVQPAAEKQAQGVGLALPWKVAIGAVLLTNLVLLYLWQTDSAPTTQIAASPRTDADSSTSSQEQTPSAPGVRNAAESRQPRKILPGIAAPRDVLPSAPIAAAESTPASGTARTFKPSGKPITIAEPGEPLAGTASPETGSQSFEFQAAPAPTQTADPGPADTPTRTTTRKSPRDMSAAEREALARATIAELNQQKLIAAAEAQAARQSPADSQQPPDSETANSAPVSESITTKDVENAPVTQGITELNALESGPRSALNALSFSTHIYGNEDDLRAVVVNGKRLVKGNSITADERRFTLLQVTDDGVVLEFDYEGDTHQVLIAGVMGDWQDA